MEQQDTIKKERPSDTLFEVSQIFSAVGSIFFFGLVWLSAVVLVALTWILGYQSLAFFIENIIKVSIGCLVLSLFIELLAKHQKKQEEKLDNKRLIFKQNLKEEIKQELKKENARTKRNSK